MIKDELTASSDEPRTSMRSIETPAPPRGFTQREFRDAVGHYASGITIVTAHDGVEPIGTTCQSFFSQSLNPPLVALSFRHESASLPRFIGLGKFCVNVLAGDQRTVSDRFAAVDDRWAETGWEPAASGNPRLTGASAWFDCTVERHLALGDHTILVGRVLDLGVSGAECEPIIFHRGKYCSLGKQLSHARPTVDVDATDEEIWAVLHG